MATTNVTAITVAGGLVGGFTAKKHKFVGAMGGAIIGAVLGSLLETYTTPYVAPADNAAPQPLRGSQR